VRTHKCSVAAISATAPKAAAAVVVAATEPATVGAAADPADLAASRNGATTAVPNAAGDRIEVRLPLRDVSGDTSARCGSVTHTGRAPIAPHSSATRGNSRPACTAASRTPVICSTRIHTNPARQHYLRTAAGR